VNFFHGVAGKYDLDNPSHLPIGFEQYDRVAFVNADRMQRYLDRGIVAADAAVLVGFPKLDVLVNGGDHAAAVRRDLGLAPGRPTALYAPTWSPASSLHLAGEAIVASLAGAGWNVIIKPHAWSFDPDAKYSGGIDWRGRLSRIEQPGRVVLRDDADASALLAAADLMVTDHSSIGFEFCLLDRPLIVFDAPDLAEVARINPERIAALRSAARVVSDPTELGRVALEELAHRGRRSAARAAVARTLFHDPGRATERALTLVYELLELPRPCAAAVTARQPEPLGVRP
jgi:CDP-glycerol glycerophosphotransferase